MNAEQLHTVISLVVSDVDNVDIVKNFDALITQLNQLAGNPADQNLQQNAANTKDALIKSLDLLDDKQWPSGIKQTVEDLGGTALVGEDTKAQIINSFQSVGVVPATVRQEIENIRNDVADFIVKIRELSDAFTNLNIHEEPLSKGEIELGCLIPRTEIDNQLGKLGTEIEQIDKIFKLFSVVAVGHREEFELTYISASDPKLFIKPNIKTAALISTTVAMILTSLNQVADLKLKYNEIIQAGISEESLKDFEKAISDKLEADIEKFKMEIIGEFDAGLSGADKNENINRLTKAIDGLAPRLERGYGIEFRLGEIPEQEEGSEDEEGGAIRHMEDEFYEKLRGEAQTIKRLPPIGKPILNLPDKDDLDE